ncbi:MAG: hypothetical protein ACI9DC_000343 [Gammaproteobacteria bacterium]|jgi:uncharacterized protein YjiS (DUF1127 family)
MSAHINKPAYDQDSPRQRTFDRLLSMDWLWASFKRSVARNRQRTAPAKLDGRVLANVGVTRGQARAESTKSNWQR